MQSNMATGGNDRFEDDEEESDDGAASSGRVSKLRQNWLMHEDGALAHKLQSAEYASHLSGNKMRNGMIRQDFPTAMEEQTREMSHMERERRAHLDRLRAVEERDAEVARQLEYEATRDEVFARRIHRALNTPPLPVTANGDVPAEASFLGGGGGGVRYEDERYQVKMARPAVVKAEPLYANNKPEHYAVSSPYDDRGGASGCAGAAGHNPMELLGLSQRDLVMSKRVEAQLEQEKRDRELARRLQEQLSCEDLDDGSKAAAEARDLELAKQLHAKEKAKLQRAKERARAKKQQQQQMMLSGDLSGIVRQEEESQSRSGSRMSGGVNHSAPIPELSLPARRPYMNREAIDSHVSSSCGGSDTEPQYENLRKQQMQQKPLVPQRFMGDDDEDVPVPPYMPMQQASNKKTSSLEKRISRKKEKEGCKQQ